MTNKTSQRGRRPGKPDTRRVILAAARRRFLEDGYHTVTMRSIADEAEVDLALLSYYFGSKKGLFGAALALSANPAELAAQLLSEGDLDTFPERALRRLITAWDAPESGDALAAMLRNAAQDDSVAALVKEALEGEIVSRLADVLGGRHASERAAACTAVLAGLIFTRYLLGLEPISSMDREELIRLFSPQLRLAMGMPTRRSSRHS
ncbi:TetR/AcrR family transcriptional regulator [Streptomyces naganishii]|uniref:TetR/AcrR family transcriptional regulator n=1 Tax=Streptomyces naganishii TaxID=285447 RepID=UPI001E618527|nr:TetR family transcriptional regulator [Streptomyces naganishii]